MTVHTPHGPATVVRGTGGNIKTIHTGNGMTINHVAHGGRTVVSVHNGTRVVTVGHGSGFIQHPGRPGFTQRTYVNNGRVSVRIYQNHTYRGIGYQTYVPGGYFHAGFYGWAFNPWPGRIAFGWGWGNPPWFYGGYFAPAPFYPSASLWLADYLLAANLQAAYADQTDAGDQGAPPDNSGAGGQVQLSDQVRQAIADEVQRQLAAENAAATNPQQVNQSSTGDQVPPALNPDDRIFVVSSNLSVVDGDESCDLTPGDVVSRVDDTPDGNQAVRVAVVSSKQSDCRLGAMPSVQVSDLQDMQNDMHAQMDSGLQTLAKDQGTNGLPPAPDATLIPNSAGTGTPDPNAAAQLQQQQNDANQAEQEVKQAAGQGGGGARNLQPAGKSPVDAAPPTYHAGAVPVVKRPAWLELLATGLVKVANIGPAGK
jgi:hypothetical protein